MPEKDVVEAIVGNLTKMGFNVATEVPNLYRSANIAAVDISGNVWVIECKISSIGRAIHQLRIHQLGADMVFVGTPYRETREETLEMIRQAGVGLIYLMPDGSITEAIKPVCSNRSWPATKEKLRQRVLQATQ